MSEVLVVSVHARLDSSAGLDAHAGPSSEGVLCESKFQQVRSARDALARARLTDILTTSSPTLVLLAAPPGFGKTTLLAQWRELDSRAFACLSLDPADNDPLALWSYIVDALAQTGDSFENARSALRRQRVDGLEAVIHAVLNDLDARRQEVVLVLDDYQAIGNRTCHDSLAFFLERAPRNLTLAISTRFDPPIAVGRLRALAELLEFRAGDLAFTEAEQATLLNETLHLDLAPESLSVLFNRVEGWPAGVRLAAASLRNADDRAAFVERFGGANRHVADYLTEVVLDTLDEQRRRFLLETSVLDSMSGALCDAATGRDGSAELLVELEAANLFVVPLDDRREWYRYHHLFAEVLRSHLLRSDSDLAREIHRRSSVWLADEGYTREAVHHALVAREVEAAATLMLHGWCPTFDPVAAEVTLRRLEEFPAGSIDSDARLALIKAWTMSVLNRREEALLALETAEAEGFGQGRPPGIPFEAQTALVRACFPWGDAARMLQAATRACELQGGRLWIGRPVALLALGWAQHFTGEAELARGPLEQAAFLAARSEQWLVAGIAKALLARISLAADDGDAALSAAQAAVRILEAHDVADHPGAGVAYVALGAVLAHRDAFDEADQVLEQGLANLRARGQALDLADALLVSAPVRRALEAPAPARGILEKARTLIESCSDPGMLRGRLEEVARTLTPAHRRIEGDSELTERELEVLSYLAQGLSKREIGKVLFLSFNTIHSHTKSIYRKLRVSSREEAVARARELGAAVGALQDEPAYRAADVDAGSIPLIAGSPR